MQSTPVNEKEAQAEFVPEKITFFTTWKKYRTWKGRSSRKEYWYFFLPFLFLLVLFHLCFLLDPNKTTINSTAFGFIFIFIFGLKVILCFLGLTPIMALCSRRLHDIGLSSAWFSIYFLLSWSVFPVSWSVLSTVCGKYIPITYAVFFWCCGGYFYSAFVFFLLLGCVDSQGGINKYGNNPKGEGENKQNLIQKLQMRSILLKNAVVFICFLFSLSPVIVISIMAGNPALWHRDADTQYDLGVRFTIGAVVGGYKDIGIAMMWYRKAAEQGHADAQYALGSGYLEGHGVARDYSEAVKWYRKSAEQGNAAAQFRLGLCYANGYGVEKNFNEAMKWYRIAAEKGSAEAQFSLGLCYAYGYGVEKNFDEALKWYRRSAEQGNAEAQFIWGACYANGYGVAKDPTEAVKWYRRAAKSGYAEAQFSLGLCYAIGDGVEKDVRTAVRWFREAVEQGHMGAAEALKALGEK